MKKTSMFTRVGVGVALAGAVVLGTVVPAQAATRTVWVEATTYHQCQTNAKAVIHGASRAGNEAWAAPCEKLVKGGYGIWVNIRTP